MCRLRITTIFSPRAESRGTLSADRRVEGVRIGRRQGRDGITCSSQLSPGHHRHREDDASASAAGVGSASAAWHGRTTAAAARQGITVTRGVNRGGEFSNNSSSSSSGNSPGGHRSSRIAGAQHSTRSKGGVHKRGGGGYVGEEGQGACDGSNRR